LNRIISFVWNNFDNDDRVKKKALTLSKKNQVIVYCVPKPNQYKQAFKQVNNNLQVRYIKVRNMFYWLFYRLVANEYFWKKVFDLKDLQGDFESLYIECNDPDTLFMAKYIHNYKIHNKVIYDSHEFWKGTRRKETFLFYTLYTYIGNTIQYWREKKYVSFADKLITVSPSIANILEEKYNKETIVIYNFCEYQPSKNCYFKNPKSAVFVGSYLRNGIYDLASELYDDDYHILMIGNIKPKHKWVEYAGYVPKWEYLKKLSQVQIGMAYTVVDHKNMKYSIPNKLSEYVQLGLIPIVNNEMIDSAYLVYKYNIGLAITKNDFSYSKELLKDPKFILRNRDKVKTIFINKLNKLLEDDDLYRRLELAKKEYCWESQEQRLLEYYD
jgi:hypothetical protein